MEHIVQSTRLSPCDSSMLGFTRTVSFAYRKCPDIVLMERNLQVLTHAIPDAAGQLDYTPDGETCIRHNGTGVALSVVNAEQPMPNYGAQLLLAEDANNRDLRSYYEKPFTLDFPLLQFRMTRFIDGGALLSMELAHALTDGVGRGLLLTYWARLCRGESPLPTLDHNRTQLIKLAQDYYGEDDSREFVEISLKELGSRVQTSGVYSVIVIARDSLDEERARCVSRGDMHISKQDVLAAKLWHVYSQVQRTGTTSKLSIVLDFRRCAEMGLGPGYFGNAVTFARLQYNSEQVRTASVGDLAQRIRHSIGQTLTRQNVSRELFVAWRYRRVRQGGLVAISREDLENIGREHLVINNLCRFPVNELDFGSGAPFWVGGLKQPNAPSVGIFPLAGRDGDGYALHLNFARPQMDAFLEIVRNDPFFSSHSHVHSIFPESCPAHA